MIRHAREDDLPAIVRLLADDDLGRERERVEHPVPECYTSAFREINSDPSHELLVVEDAGVVVATAQVSFLQYLTHQGGRRAQVEAVRVLSERRGAGVGRTLFEYIIARARDRGCWVVQLTTDKRRPEACRFYESLGFEATHEGMKLRLSG